VTAPGFTDRETKLPRYLAVVRVGSSRQLPPPVSIGSSADFKVGQMAFAIGNPFGLDQSLTSGIISALNAGCPRAAGHWDGHRPHNEQRFLLPYCASAGASRRRYIARWAYSFPGLGEGVKASPAAPLTCGPTMGNFHELVGQVTPGW
jgi:trypsin-like peptidase